LTARPLSALAFVLLALPVLSTGLAAQDARLGRLHGRVIADGAPIDRVVEVRLDSQTLGKTLATAYTLEGDEFSFLDVPVNSTDSYFVVINEDGYKEVRVRLDTRSFVRGFNDPSRLEFSGILVLYLERNAADTPGHDPAIEAGRAPAVDVRVLTAVIPPEAREAYAEGLEHVAADEPDDAIERLEEAVELAPEYYDALNKLGIEYLKVGRYRDAEAILERARDLGPRDPRPLLNLGMLFLQEAPTREASQNAGAGLESYERAAGLLEEAVQLDPLAPEANYYLGSALYQTGDLDRAEYFLQEALGLDTDLHDARLALLNVYTRQQRYPEALEQLRAYLRQVPDSPQKPALEAIRLQLEVALHPPR
jgi:Tfp pilus assembly protein PilF